MDNINVSKVFGLVEEEFMEYIRCEFLHSASQLDILVDIISRDGNSIIKQDWFSRLYEKELHSFETRLQAFKAGMEAEKSEVSPQRPRDYRIYRECLQTAFTNDGPNNLDHKVTDDEQSIEHAGHAAGPIAGGGEADQVPDPAGEEPSTM